MATRKKTLKTVSIGIIYADSVFLTDTADAMYATMALNDFLAGRDITANVGGNIHLISYHAVQTVFVAENVTSTEATDAFCAD